MTIPITDFYSQLDAVVADSATRRPACKSGCSYCCYIRVVVQAHEIFHIVQFMQTKFPPERIRQALDRARENRKRIDPLSVQQHIATNIPCPLLENGQCSVYPARPAKCRAYHSLDVKVCEAAHIDTTYSAPHPYDVPVALAAANYQNSFTQAVAQHGLDAGYYELNGALISAFTSADSAKRWRNGKRSFPAKYSTDE